MTWEGFSIDSNSMLENSAFLGDWNSSLSNDVTLKFLTENTMLTAVRLPRALSNNLDLRVYISSSDSKGSLQSSGSQD